MTSSDDLSRAITFLRGERSQAEVARRAGIDPAVWSLYERGQRQPRAKNLERILRGLGCTRLELEETRWRIRRYRLMYEGDPQRRPSLEDNEIEKELRDAVGQLSRALERALIVLARRSLPEKDQQ